MAVATSSRWRRLARFALLRLPAFLLLWWVLAEGDTYRAWIGVLAAVVAAAVSQRVWRPPTRPVPWRALLAFVPYFLWHSFVAGFDVSRRALAPKLELEPALTRVRLRLRDDRARVLLAWTVSLFPGTAGIRLHKHYLDVHLLDQRYLTQKGLRALEVRVAALFCETLPASEQRDS